MTTRFLLPILICVGLIPACKTTQNGGANPAPLDHHDVVETYAQIVHATYSDSLNSAKEMSRKINAFLAAPTQEGLVAAKESWIKARLPYLQTEVYRFYDGPIDDKDGPEGLLNAWPMDEAYVDYVQGMPEAGIINDKESYPDITKELLVSLNEKDGEENISCGYHAIEFLLWGQDLRADGPGNRPHTDYTTEPNAERRKQFLRITVSLLLENLQDLVGEWENGKDNYRSAFVKNDPKKSIQKILTGMTLLSGFELAGERLLVAYESRAQEDEHSCFSDTTHLDAIYDIVGIMNVWKGRYESSNGSTIQGPGIQALASAKNSSLSADINKKLKASLAASKAVPPPFDQAILAEDGSAARKTILALIEELENVADGLVEISKEIGVIVAREPEE